MAKVGGGVKKSVKQKGRLDDLISELEKDPLAGVLAELEVEKSEVSLGGLLTKYEKNPLKKILSTLDGPSRATLAQTLSSLDAGVDTLPSILESGSLQTISVPTISGVIEATTVSESIAKVITDATTTIKTKTSQVIDVVALTRSETVTARSVEASLVSRAFATIWANSRPILYTIVWSTMIVTSIGLIQIYIGGGSWDFLLGILKYIGCNAVPAIIYSTLRKAGVSLAAGMTINQLISLAEKNERVAAVLRKDIKPEIVVASLNRMGIDVSKYDLTVKNAAQNIATTAISGGFALYSGGVGSYVTSMAFSYGTAAAGSAIGTVVGGAKTTVAAAKKSITEAITDFQKVPDLVVNEVLVDATRTVEVVDAVELTTDIETEIFGPVDAKREAKVEKIIASADVKEEVSKSVMEVLIENRALAVGTLAASAMIGLAVSGNEMAQRALFGVVMNKIGLSKVIDGMVDYLTPEDVTALKKVDTRRSQKGLKPKYIDTFLATILGDRLFEESELKSMSIEYLKIAANNKNLKYPKTVSRQALIKAILEEQTARLANLNQLIAKHLLGVLKVSLTAATVEAGYRGVSKIDVGQVKQQIEKLTASIYPGQTIDDSIKVDASLEADVDRYQRSQEEIAASRIDQDQVDLRTKEIEARLAEEARLQPVHDPTSEENIRLGEQAKQEQDAVKAMMEKFKTQARTERARVEDAEAKRLAENLKLAAKHTQQVQDRKIWIREEKERRAFARHQAETEAKNAALNQVYEEGLADRRAAIDAIRAERRAAREAAAAQGASIEQQTQATDLAEARIAANDRTKAVWERRQATRRLQDALRMKDVESKMKIAVADVDGTVHQIPEASVFMSEELQKALDWNMLPFVPWMSLMFSKSSLSSVPVVGTVNGAMETTNTILDIAQTVKKGINIANIALQMQGNEALEKVADAEKLDSYLQYRLPSLSGALESFVRAYGSVVPKDIVLRELGNAAIHPEMTTADIALNIGSQFILGEKLGIHTADTIRSVGSWFADRF